MTIGVSYMGTKQRLTSYVAKLASECRTGGFLDLFAGMCSVASAIGPSRQLWANDLQVFSTEVAIAKFCSQDRLLAPHDVAALSLESYRSNRESCEVRYSDKLRVERVAIRRKNASALRNLLDESAALGHSPKRTGDLGYILFSQYFGGTYFGVAQAIEIDSIRCAIDHHRAIGNISPDQHRWLLLALCVALGRCSTTTGQFAQPLAPKSGNLNRFIIQRSRSIWQEWLAAVGRLTPVGARQWRLQNRVYRSDALALLDELTGTRPRPRVVYADPPYTKDQYSRYYHLYETAILYDYPGTQGRGQYRPDRQVSDFCLAAKVEDAFSRLIEKCANLKADLIISYPSTGLLKDSRRRIPDLIKQHYRRKPDRVAVPHKHSTLGGSKGAAQSSVVEVFYRVSCNA